jgi:DNA-binding MarR family transcriptional regulator
MNSDLGPEHKAAWITFLVSQSVLKKQIDKALTEQGQVTLDVYDVLLSLEGAEGQRLRMSELADSVLLSRSGITRLVDRLEREGYVRRESCPGDRRSLWAVLTPAGLSAREEAWPVYRAAISELFAQKMHPDEAKVLTRVFLRVLEDYPPCLLHGMPDGYEDSLEP